MQKFIAVTAAAAARLAAGAPALAAQTNVETELLSPIQSHPLAATNRSLGTAGHPERAAASSYCCCCLAAAAAVVC